ncbi:MAG TPA: AI-2E family transporter, partial [Myxococcota bacterium]|nr:AI-2E family transporter [Myxococcota bacterium]
METPVIAQPAADSIGDARSSLRLQSDGARATVTTEVTVHTPIRWRRVGWWAAIVGLLALAVYTAAQVRTVTIPMLLSLTVAYALDPAVDRFEARGVSRTLAILILMAAFLVGSVTVVAVLGPQITEEVLQLPDKLRQLLFELRPWVRHVFKVELPTSLDAVLATLQAELASTAEAGVGALARSAGMALKVVFGGTVSVLASLGGLIMIPVFVFYLLRDFDRLTAALKDLVPHPARPAVYGRMAEIDTTLAAFVRGQLMVGGILAVLYAVGFTLIGLPLGLLVGVITGMGNMVPYVGSAVGLTAATLMAFLGWHGWSGFALVYVVFIVNHVLEGWFITPRIVGNSVGLSPFLVMVAILVFGDLFGFFGVLVAVPLAAILKILLCAALEHYRASAFFTGESSLI